MPPKWLITYWAKAAAATLPFLKYRKVAVQQVFDQNIIYRRHGDKGLPDKTGWIQIKNIKDIQAWANLHAYSFHSHLHGEKDTWFVMDIDGRRDNIFPLTRIVAYELSKLLTKQGIKSLIKFSGHRGFHFLWSLGKVTPNWLRLRKQLRQYVAELNPILEKNYSAQFRKYIPRSLPILATSSTDKALTKCILVDEQIIHKNGMIRSPYSIHPSTGLVSVPLASTQLLRFNPASAAPSRVKIRNIKLPLNRTYGT